MTTTLQYNREGQPQDRKLNGGRPPIRRQLAGTIGSFSRISLWHWIVLLIVICFVGIPLVFLVLGSFSTASLPTDFSPSKMGLDNYEKVWANPDTYRILANTLIYVANATAVGLGTALLLAWLVERTNIPGKIWIYAGVPMTLAVPGMLQAMAWVLLMSPKIGVLNSVVMVGLSLESAPFNIYSLAGISIIEGLRLVPTAFLMLVPLLRSMDPSLEEAASMSGASPYSKFQKVTLPVLVPGLLAILIYQAMTALEAFEVPGILGIPAGIYVFSTKIYSALHPGTGFPAYGEASTLAILYVLIAVSATYVYSRIISHSERYTIITGKGYRPRELDLGPWRWVAFGAVTLYLLMTIILPFLALLYVSLLPYMQPLSLSALSQVSFDNYRNLWNTELTGAVLWNTLVMTLLAATFAVVLSFMASLVIVRSQFWGRKIVDQLAFMPHAIPGIVMGVAFLWLFLQMDEHGVPIYGGILSISIAFAVGFMAYGTRSINAAILQIHKDLEEAAYTSGAPHWRTMMRVFCPLLLPSLVGVWIWSALHSVRIAGTPLILYEGAENQVLAVLIWNLWDFGEVGMVGAIGVLLIILLLAVTLGLRLVGFGRGVSIQKSQ